MTLPNSLAALAALLLLAPGGLADPPDLAAQSGTIRYERSLTRTRAELGELLGGARPGTRPGGDAARGGGAGAGRVPGGRVPPGGAQPGGARGGEIQEYAALEVTFDGTTALTRITPLAPDGSARGAGGAGGAGLRARDGAAAGARGGAVAQRLQQGLAARGLPGVPTRRTTAIWVDAASGERVESVDFMTRDFRVVDEVEPWAWRLLGEESEFLGYVVQKAVAERDSSTVEAWFTVEIPGFAAPEGYTGLPGVVLMVSVDRGRTLIQATEVDLDSPVEPVERPSEGEEITAEDFEALVAEKTEEFRAEMQSRRRGGGGGA